MKVAYLVLAHSHPDLLLRLVRAIRAPWADIYIHIDRKAKAAPFQEALAGETVHFLENRVKVNWAGWSQFEATLSLLRIAAERHEYKYYKILSAFCHPIKSREHIEHFFAKQEANLVNCWPSGEGLSFHIDYRYPVDRIPIENFLRPEGFRAHPLRELLRHPIQIGYWGLFYRCVLNHPRLGTLWRQRMPLPKPCRWGDAWWCLRHDFVVFMLEYLRQHPEALRFFKYTRSPEEIVVPTLLGLSGHPYRDLKVHFNHYPDSVSSLVEGSKMRYVHRSPDVLFGRKLDNDGLAQLREDWRQMKSDPVIRAKLADLRNW